EQRDREPDPEAERARGVARAAAVTDQEEHRRGEASDDQDECDDDDPLQRLLRLDGATRQGPDCSAPSRPVRAVRRQARRPSRGPVAGLVRAVVPTVAALVVVALTLSLGNWQTRRAQEKLQLQQQR